MRKKSFLSHTKALKNITKNRGKLVKEVMAQFLKSKDCQIIRFSLLNSFGNNI